MKILKTDKTGTASWGSPDANFPAANLQDDWPGHVTRSTLVSDTISIPVYGAADALFVANVEATDCTVTIKDGGGVVVATYPLDLSRVSHAWISYPAQQADHTIDLSLSAASAVGLGLARAGAATVYSNADWGIVMSLKDLSVSERLASGGTYTSDRDVIRIWSGSVVFDPQDQDAWAFIRFKRSRRKRPFACLVLDGIDDEAHAGWVRFGDQDPSWRLSGPADDVVRFQLIEEV